MASFPRVIFLAILASIVLAQPSPPVEGVQIGDADGEASGLDIRFPLTVTQCEPVFIFIRFTAGSFSSGAIHFHSLDNVRLLSIGPFLGTGYVEWVCNVPAGRSLVVFSRPGTNFHQFTVQPGPSSSCLRNITATYSFASYVTSQFTSYTALLQVTSTFSGFASIAAT